MVGCGLRGHRRVAVIGRTRPRLLPVMIQIQRVDHDRRQDRVTRVTVTDGLIAHDGLPIASCAARSNSREACRCRSSSFIGFSSASAIRFFAEVTRDCACNFSYPVRACSGPARIPPNPAVLPPPRSCHIPGELPAGLGADSLTPLLSRQRDMSSPLVKPVPFHCDAGALPWPRSPVPTPSCRRRRRAGHRTPRPGQPGQRPYPTTAPHRSSPPAWPFPAALRLYRQRPCPPCPGTASRRTASPPAHCTGHVHR